MRIGQVAKLAGVAANTIRYYERVGVLSPASRSASGYRQYGESAVTRLRFIRRARALGFSLADLKELTTALDGERRVRRPRLLALVRSQLSTVRARQDELHALHRELQAVARRLASSRRLNQHYSSCRCLEAGASPGTRDTAMSMPMSLAPRHGS